ncbi:MAG TPA: hypothetical protein EYP19_05365 [Desulfobacterales bacterium]|nr:hypothetical protein [Desulfobacterales bacterium]
MNAQFSVEFPEGLGPVERLNYFGVRLGVRLDGGYPPNRRFGGQDCERKCRLHSVNNRRVIWDVECLAVQK